MACNDNGVKRPIYLDYHSTTPVDKRVAEKVLYYMTEAFGNPSSVTHCYSDEAVSSIETAYKDICELINCAKNEIIFTSGATESVNLAISGHLMTNQNVKHKIAVSPVEHKCVLDTCKTFSKKGLSETVFLEVDEKGRLDLVDLEKKCQEGLSLICVMAANNEIGNIYPIKEICEIAEKFNIAVLCDATQAVGKIPLDFANWKISYLAMSAHKMYGPKGIGALVIRKERKVSPMMCGGGQQKGIRPGTLNVSGIVGLGEACKISKLEMETDNLAIKAKRDRMQTSLQARFPEIIVNGDIDSKLSGNLSICVRGIPNDEIIGKVRDKIAISTGSACSSGFQVPSHVLTALKLPNDIIMSTLRIGVGKYTTDEQIDEAIEVIAQAISEVKEAQTLKYSTISA